MQHSLSLSSKNLIENQNELLYHPDFRTPLIGVVHTYRDRVHTDYGRDTSIGKDFDCYKINNPANSMPFTHVNFMLNKQGGLGTCNSVAPFNYSTAKTSDDQEIERQTCQVKYFDESHAPLVLSNAPTPY